MKHMIQKEVNEEHKYEQDCLLPLSNYSETLFLKRC